MLPKFEDFINEGKVSIVLDNRQRGMFTVSTYTDRSSGFFLQFIPDSRTSDMPKKTQIDGIKSNLKRIFPGFYDALVYHPLSSAAGISFRLDTFAFADYLTNEINRMS